MKRLLLFLSLFALTVTLAACQNAAETSAVRQDTAQTTKEITDAETARVTEADTTHADIVFDTTPVIQNKGDALIVPWNPYCFSPLVTDEYQEAFEKAAHAILNRRLTVTLDSKNELYAVSDNLFYEFPPSALASWEANENNLTLTFTYRYEREEHLEKVFAFKDKIEDILQKTLVYGDKDAEKAILLYHYVAKTVDYFTTDFEDFKTNAFYGLLENRGICYTFTDAYNYLLRQVGVDAYLVKGYRAVDRAEHGWSLVKAEGKYYHCDVTWEANYLSGISFYYFGMNDTRRDKTVVVSDATVGEGILQTKLSLSANGEQFNAISGDKFRQNTWKLDRDKRVIHYNGKEYSYDQ